MSLRKHSTGQARTKPSKKQSIFMGLFFFSLIPFGLCLMLTVNLSEKDLAFSESTKGKVVSKAEVRRPNKNREYYTSDFIRYKIPGDTTNFSLRSDSETTYQIGDSVDLIYNKERPNMAILKSEKPTISNEEVKMAQTAVYPLGILSFILLVLSFRNGTKSEKNNQDESIT